MDATEKRKAAARGATRALAGIKAAASIDRRTELDAFLNDHMARRLWCMDEAGMSLDAYTANGHQFLVLRYADGEGWDVYVPASETNNIGITLAALHDHIAR